MNIKKFLSLSFIMISFISADEPIDQNESKEIVLTFINKTDNKILATFHNATALLNPALYNEHNDDNEPVQYILDYSYYLNEKSNPQIISLSKRQLGQRNIDEGILDLTTAQSCTLFLFDQNTKLRREYSFTIQNNATITIMYSAGILTAEQASR